MQNLRWSMQMPPRSEVQKEVSVVYTEGELGEESWTKVVALNDKPTISVS